MYTAVKGIYENGVLTFLEPAPNFGKSEVLVMFLNEEKVKPLKKRTPGGLLRLAQLKGKKIVIPNDFNEPLDELNDYM